METTIVVAGATGNLGGSIVEALLEHGVIVCAPVRTGTLSDKIEKLERRGVRVVQVDMSSVADIAAVCEGASCVISALQGMQDVIVGTQSVLLDAAIAAGVPRFIPSDFCIDFAKLPLGENRNLDFRWAFHERLDAAPIAATSILNGAFSGFLTSISALLDMNAKRVSYWGNADQLMDFTTIDNTAAFTAAAALDPSAPKVLRIAGDQISARELALVAGEATGSHFDLVRLGSLVELAALIQASRTADPSGNNELFPKWQGMQYLHNMFGGLAKLEPLDNDRYSSVKWTNAQDMIAAKVTALAGQPPA